MRVSSRTLEPALYRYRFGSAEFDEARFELTVGGLPIELERKPLRVLAALLEQPGQLVSKAELRRRVWDDRLTVEQVLTNAVTKLRKALGEDGHCVMTVPRLGYRLTGPVQRVAVGRRLVSRLKLTAGEPMPGREDVVMERQLAASHGGEVWLARQGSDDSGTRRVFKFSVDSEQLAALKREATIFRLLKDGLGERDDIVRAIDWNFETEPFYLECEYAGESLNLWVEKDGRLAALALPERIDLFLRIADAVAAAHSVGVLHRDLKPENVLVDSGDDGRLRVRVADFGSGRLVEPERLEPLEKEGLGLAMTRSVVDDSRTGTPLYLAPELIMGQPPTIQSDVYALGYMLYQILVGDLNKPMSTGWERDFDAAPLNDELLKEDIAAATDGDALRRLASVPELIERLRKLDERRAERLRTRDVERRAVAAERALERARARRPWRYALLSTLIVGLAVSLWLYREQTLARIAAQRETARAEAINRFLNEDLLGAADPTRPGGGDSLRDVLERASVRLQPRFAREPDTEAALALTIGNAYFGLSDYAQAQTYQGRALDMFRSTRGDSDPNTLETAYRLARTLEMEARYGDADALLAQADKAAGRQLTEATPLAMLAHWSRGGNWLLQMQPQRALAEFETLERIRAQIDPDGEVWLFRVRENLAWCYSRLHRDAEAERALQPLLPYAAEQVGILDWAKVRLFYGLALTNLSRWNDARQMMQAALDGVENKLGPDHYVTALALNHLAFLYQTQGEWTQALDYARRSHDILSRRLGDHAHATLMVLGNLGAIEFLGGDSRNGLQALSDSYRELLQQRGEAVADSQIVAFYLASADNAMGHADDAWALVAACDPAKLAVIEPGSDWEQRLNGLKGQILLSQGRRTEALPLLDHAVARLVAAGAPQWQLQLLQASLALARDGVGVTGASTADRASPTGG